MYFISVNLALSLIVSAIQIPYAMFAENVVDRVEWAFFSMFMIDEYKYMMRYPTKEFE